MAGEVLTRKMTVGLALREEVTEGTLIAERAQDACLIRADGFEPPNLAREMLGEGYLTGSFSKTAPVIGMFGDLGFKMPVFARGKGTLTYPDFHVALKSVMGIEEANTDDAVAASGPAPNTTIFAANSGANDLIEGQLILVNLTGYGYFVTRIIDITDQVITVWPPFPVTPTALDVVYAGINEMLSSSTWPTFSAYFHFDGPKQAQLSGCRATSLKMEFTVGQRVNLDFTVKGISAVKNNNARGLTPTVDAATRPPTCLAMTLDMVYAGVAKGTPTPTQTIITAPAYAAAAGDEILIDVGALGSPVVCTFTNASELVNSSAHGLLNGARVKFTTTGALPTGLSADIIYFVVNKNADDFQVSLTSGGTAVTFSTDGSGTNSYSVWTKSTGNWQTLAISTVSGDPGSDTTITHATATNRADAGDTVYIRRKMCAGIGDTLSITVEMKQELIKCMQASYGVKGSTFTGRDVKIEKTPYFNSWQEFLTLDGLISAELRVILGNTLNNIFVVYFPNLINMEASLTGDDLMKVKSSAQATVDTRFLGNDHEMVIATF